MYKVKFWENWNNSFGGIQPSNPIITTGVIGNKITTSTFYNEDFGGLTIIPSEYTLISGNCDIIENNMYVTIYGLSGNAVVEGDFNIVSSYRVIVTINISGCSDYSPPTGIYGSIKMEGKKDGSWTTIETKYVTSSSTQLLTFSKYGNYTDIKLTFTTYNDDNIVGEYIKIYDIKINLWQSIKENDAVELISADIDPIKFIGDDFFMREPRKCKLILQDNEDNFLLNNFVYSTGDYKDEINVVIYYDEDGEIIELPNPPDDPNWTMGDDVDGQTVTDKETIMQQLSKIVIEVWNDDNLEYTGIIDKTASSYDLDYVTLECVDFLWIFKTCAEQFIKPIFKDSEDKQYDIIASPILIIELFNKISNLTNINIITSPDYNLGLVAFNSLFPYDLTQVNGNFNDICYNGLLTYGSGLDIGYITSFMNDFLGGSLSNPYEYGYTTNSKVVLFFTSDEIYACISTFARCTYMGGEDITVKIKGAVRYYRFNLSGDYIEVNIWTRNEIYHTWENIGSFPDWNYYTNLFKKNYGLTYVSETMQLFKDSLDGSTTLYTIENNTSCLNIAYDVFIYKTLQKYYTVGIPLYSNTYKYLDIIKTILFLNNITIYSTADGTITFAKRDFNNMLSVYISRDKILKPFSVNATARDDAEIDVLSIVYYSEDTKDMYVGPNGEFLDSYMKQMYQTIFNKIPVEVSFSIRAENDDETLIDITPGCLICINGYSPELPQYVVVTQYLYDKDNFEIDIKGYKYVH